ncbi:PREDICTED: uncharacterized protein LOC109587091 [Amphimedon queenslandica]|uniref:Reverse transcriptase domain-containing protein n=1 Tax=Amphimedon queenslandica TaxID=400682 RepID=A0AAN0JPX5_AMPQE|nr:PREDICTED: uncharacterized protein LOC109587091 [Amphimedon queenslandica]|eukprot:XP_019858872.1 PREDICTED: uncharacterized protein LOC109587091 [Amphimedon queenslandica]
MPDQDLAGFLERGIRWGFTIGFKPGSALEPATSNMSSVTDKPEVVSKYIEEEVAAGRLRPSTVTQLSPIGLIPKKNKPGCFRMIVDLSSPKGRCVNDGIPSKLCSLHYASVAEAAQRMVQCGRGALMAKIDLKSAYRMVPVRPEDSLLLGIQWEGITYADFALPFGLRSAPILFSAVADGLAWALFRSGVEFSIHYLDDFFFCGPPSSLVCRRAMEIALPLCQKLGLPVAPEKVEGPATSLTFLGIQLNSDAMSLSLPQEKLASLKLRLSAWVNAQAATKQELQELLGHLNHAAAVVRPGRSFVRAIIEAMKRPRLPHQKTRLDANCKADIKWWSLFVADWNGISALPPSCPVTWVISDASGSWGCGAFDQYHGSWFQLPWPASWAEVNIAAKELLPVVIAAAVWGRRWAGQRVLFLSDNTAVVAALSSRSACHPILAHLLKCLFFWEAKFDFEHSADHIPGCLRAHLHPTSASSPAHRPQSSVDLSQLGEVVQRYFEHGLAPSSNRTYSSAKSCCMNFCHSAGLAPYPLSQGTLCLFAAFLAQRRLAPRSISTNLSAVRHLEVQSSATSSTRSDWPYLQYVLRGIKLTAQGNLMVRSRLPITPVILRKLRAVWDIQSSFLHLLLWTTATVAFFGFMRLGEVTSTSGSRPSIVAENVAIDSHHSPTIIRLTVLHSKTDPFGKGAMVFLGKTGDELCPVAALLMYLAKRPGPRTGPLLIREDGQPLSRDQFVHFLKEALGRCGIDSGRYSGHSFRIGAATSAAQAGVPDHLIKAMGHWNSEAYQVYIQSPPSVLVAVALSSKGPTA